MAAALEADLTGSAGSNAPTHIASDLWGHSWAEGTNGYTKGGDFGQFLAINLDASSESNFYKTLILSSLGRYRMG